MSLEESNEKGPVSSLSSETRETPVTVAREICHARVVEGGPWAWRTALGGFILQFAQYGLGNSFGIFQDYYTRVHLPNTTPTVISWIGGIQTLLAVGGSIYAGILYDMGYFYHMIWGGSFLTVFSLFMVSITKQDQVYALFLAQGIAFGVGVSLTFLPTMTVIPEHFSKRSPAVMMFVCAGGYLGALVFPILLNQLFYRPDYGFAKAVQITGGIIGGLSIIGCLLMRSPQVQVTSRRFGWSTKMVRIHGDDEVKQKGWGKVIVGCVKDAPFIIYFFSLILYSIGFYFPLFYLQLAAIVQGVNEQFAFYLFGIFAAAGLVAATGSTVIVNRFGEIPTMIVAAFATTSTVWGMLGLKDVAGSVMIAIVLGLGIGTSMPLSAPIGARLTPDKTELGRRMGIILGATAFGGLIGPPINGVLLVGAEGEFIWWKPAVFSGVFATVSCMAFAALPALIKWQDTRNSGRESTQQEKC